MCISRQLTNTTKHVQTSKILLAQPTAASQSTHRVSGTLDHVTKWVRSTSAKSKGLGYRVRPNFGPSPKLRSNLTSCRRFGLRQHLIPNFGLSLKAKTGVSSTFGLRPEPK